MLTTFNLTDHHPRKLASMNQYRLPSIIVCLTIPLFIRTMHKPKKLQDLDYAVRSHYLMERAAHYSFPPTSPKIIAGCLNQTLWDRRQARAQNQLGSITPHSDEIHTPDSDEQDTTSPEASRNFLFDFLKNYRRQ